MGIVACYDMHLYCDHPECRADWNYGQTPGQFTGYDRASTIRRARKSGWLVNFDGEPLDNGFGAGKCLCPLHSGKRKGLKNVR